MRVRKAVITAAGWGTRLLPATKALPKEVLPLFDRPIIQYAVDEVFASGIEQVIIVTSSTKQAIPAHFDRCPELERLLRQKSMFGALKEVSGDHGERIFYVHQGEQLGLGHAVLSARYFIDGEPFALVLPDDIIRGRVPGIRQLADVFERYSASVVALEEVPEDKVNSYGIVSSEPLDDRLCIVRGLVEKPAPRDAPSNLAVVGRYILAPDIFEALAAITPGSGGEIQLTDGLNSLLAKQAVIGCKLQGRRYDAGTPLGLLKASLAIACEDPATALDLQQHVAGLVEACHLPVLNEFPENVRRAARRYSRRYARSSS